MLKICNFIFKERERNGHVLILFSYKEAHKTTRHTEKVKVYSVANKEKGGSQSLRGRREPGHSTEIDTDGERQRSGEKPTGCEAGLFWDWKGNPPGFDRGFHTSLKVESPCLLKAPSFCHFSKRVFLFFF